MMTKKEEKDIWTFNINTKQFANEPIDVKSYYKILDNILSSSIDQNAEDMIIKNEQKNLEQQKIQNMKIIHALKKMKCRQ